MATWQAPPDRPRVSRVLPHLFSIPPDTAPDIAPDTAPDTDRDTDLEICFICMLQALPAGACLYAPLRAFICGRDRGQRSGAEKLALKLHDLLAA
mgnify:CR=1 FL=1